MNKDIVRNIPPSPGVYLFKDKNQDVIYVGKAKNLRRRVTTYFTQTKKLTADKQIMVTIEKTTDSFTLVYYLKVIGDKLKRLDLKDDNLIVSNKDPKGFTAAETKYVKYLFEKSYKLSLEDIKTIEANKKQYKV